MRTLLALNILQLTAIFIKTSLACTYIDIGPATICLSKGIDIENEGFEDCVYKWMDADKVDFQNNYDPCSFDSDYESLIPWVLVEVELLNSKQEKIITEIEKKYLEEKYNDVLKMYADTDFEKAFQEFKYLSYNGHKNSEYFLGSMYFDGIGIIKDESEGFFWLFKSAAEGKGDPKAMAELGWIFSLGNSVEDFNKAQKWYKLAIKKGYAFGEVMLKNLLDSKEKYNE